MPFHRLVTLRLSEWISYFLTVVPPRSRRPIAAQLPRTTLRLPDLARGRVTRALSNISLRYRKPPPKSSKPQRGRPRIYGDKLTQEAVAALPTEIVTLHVYGKWQKVRLQSIVAQARFLNGHPVRAVWSAIYDEKYHQWSPTRLYLASETDLAACEIVALYSHRWQIEPIFRILKRWWGINHL